MCWNRAGNQAQPEDVLLAGMMIGFGDDPTPDLEECLGWLDETIELMKIKSNSR